MLRRITEPTWHLADVFSLVAGAVPDRTAFARSDRSFREVAERSQQIAHALAVKGVGPGDLVGCVLPTGPELVEAVLGASAVSVAWTVQPPDRTGLERIAQMEPDGVLITARLLPDLAPLAVAADDHLHFALVRDDGSNPSIDLPGTVDLAAAMACYPVEGDWGQHDDRSVAEVTIDADGEAIAAFHADLVAALLTANSGRIPAAPAEITEDVVGEATPVAVPSGPPGRWVRGVLAALLRGRPVAL